MSDPFSQLLAFAKVANAPKIIKRKTIEQRLSAKESHHVRLLCPVGERYGMLTVLREGERREFPNCHQLYRTWVCRCDCGVVREMIMSTVRSQKAQSCGCLNTGKWKVGDKIPPSEMKKRAAKRLEGRHELT